MDENQSIKVTGEFDLPIGLTDSHGEVHQHIVMRRVKASDIEGSYVDHELKQLRGETLTISAENPAGTMVAMGAMYKFFAYLFGRTVLEFGTIPKANINRSLFSELYQSDFNFLIGKYNELNGGEVAASAAENEHSPFV
jgi:hypothetical protein